MSALAGLIAYVRREARILQDESHMGAATLRDCAAAVVEELRDSDAHHSSDGSDPKGLPRPDCGCQTCRSLFGSEAA